MPGVGGRRFSEEHAKETAKILNRIRPDFIRVRTLAIHPMSPLQRMIAEGAFEPMTDAEIVAEIRLLLEHLDEMPAHFRCGDFSLNLLMQVDGFLDTQKRAMLEELDKDYVTLAWSKGLTENQVYFKHAFRNALLPTVTAVGLRLRFLFTGAALTEIVFAWPGIGRLLNESIFRRDYYMITSIFIMVSSVILLSSLLADIMYAFVDPRIRYGDRP